MEVHVIVRLSWAHQPPNNDTRLIICKTIGNIARLPLCGPVCWRLSTEISGLARRAGSGEGARTRAGRENQAFAASSGGAVPPVSAAASVQAGLSQQEAD